MKITVITAVFNNRDTVAQALDSALAQTHPDVELIVIDGGPTDGTVEVLQDQSTSNLEGRLRGCTRDASHLRA